MKRYISNNAGEMEEWKWGGYFDSDDIEAWALKLKEVVEGMECNEDCDSRASGWVAGLEVMPGDIDCNCPRGEALRLLGEVL